MPLTNNNATPLPPHTSPFATELQTTQRYLVSARKQAQRDSSAAAFELRSRRQRTLCATGFSETMAFQDAPDKSPSLANRGWW